MVKLKLKFCLIGSGRIGAVHARNIANHPQCELKYVVDAVQNMAMQIGMKYGAQGTSDANSAFKDPNVDVVFIASPTNTHADFIEGAARAGKHIICEKPLDLSVERSVEALAVAKKAGVLLAVGFNRRHDPNFSALKAAVENNSLGQVESVHIISREPGPPSISHIKKSGGIFKDMSIHDLDMAHWLLGERPVEVYATGSCLVDKDIAAAGDIDSAIISLRTASGKLAQITNSRRAAYGYDQRVEILGTQGMAKADNERPSTVETYTEAGAVTERPLYFFLQRYEAAYKRELDDFVNCVYKKNTQPRCTGDDGLVAILLAEAASRSLQSRRPVEIDWEKNTVAIAPKL